MTMTLERPATAARQPLGNLAARTEARHARRADEHQGHADVVPQHGQRRGQADDPRTGSRAWRRPVPAWSASRWWRTRWPWVSLRGHCST